jgi:23S rRNA G2069 N7-methylase RlmK/C1962 C5-methylase RlmI
MFWFDKANPEVLYADIRDEEHVLCDGRNLAIRPDDVTDFRSLPYGDGVFNLVVFDPPHLRTAGKESWMAKKYGKLDADNWREDLASGFNECWRVLSEGGTLIFKWNETQIKLKEVLACFAEKPLFGHTTTHNLKTHWVTFYKPVCH